MEEIRRRTWAPFVGAALAALTAGSLVVFSLVAQRTSLDGFPELRIATPAERTSGRPASITVQPIDPRSVHTRGPAPGKATESEPVPVPLALIPLIPVTMPPAPIDLAGLADPAAASPSATGTGRADGETFDGRFRAEGVLLVTSRAEGSEDPDDARTAQSDARHDGKHAHKAHHAKTSKNNEKAKKKTKIKKIKKIKKGKGESHRSSSRYRAPTTPSGTRSKSSHQTSPAPRPKPSRQGPPAHSNAGGNEKSHDTPKGKGKKKH